MEVDDRRSRTSQGGQLLAEAGLGLVERSLRLRQRIRFGNHQEISQLPVNRIHCISREDAPLAARAYIDMQCGGVQLAATPWA